MLIDGIKNSLKEVVSLKYTKELNDELKDLNNSLIKEESELINKARYNDYKSELDSILEKRKKN